MRLFIALDVPNSIKEHISFLQRSLDISCLRFVHPKNIHLTLNFLGEENDIKDIIQTLHKINFSPFVLRLSSIGFFPHQYDPKVVWIGLDDNEKLFLYFSLFVIGG